MTVPPTPRLLLLVLLSISPFAFSATTEVRLMDLDLANVTTGWGEVGKGKGAGGGPLTVGGVVHPDGVGVHATSEMLFLLDGKTTRFSALVGVDDAPENAGSVIFEVVADGEKVFDSGRMSKGDALKEVDVDLSGRKTLLLRVADAGDGGDSDHGDWVNAAFTVEGAAPVSLPGWKTLSHYDGPAQMTAEAGPIRTIASPNGSVTANLFEQDGRIWIRVLRDGKPALEASPLGVTVDGVDLGRDATVGDAKAYSLNETYPWLGNQRTLTNHFQGEQIAMKTGEQAWTLDVRAYDDGVAWRYEIPGEGERKVTGEATSFAMPADSAFWTHADSRDYEDNIERYKMGEAAPNKPVVMPVTVELTNDGGYACYTEADTMGYSGMTFGVNAPLLNGVFEDDPEGWTMNGPFATPWRVVIAVKDLNALVNSSIVQSVCPPPDPKLFPEGILTEWIKPGRSYWTWGFGLFDTAQWDRIKGYVDDAATLNCQYYTIDDPWREPRMGWHRNGGDEWDGLKEVCEYAATKNVGIVVWQHWQPISELPEREEFFANVARAGAKGVKIDFMDSESQSRLGFYHSCLEIAAKHRLLVNFHGANKPAGEQRTWPNGLTREGIYGLEMRDKIQPQHWSAVAFTRLVVGAGDFTPAGMPPDRLYGGTTVALQLASAVIYTSPIEHWMDSAEEYLKQPPEVVEFIRTKPTVWDETRVLPGSKIGELAAFARRDGRNWWIGVLGSSEEEKTIEVPMPQLEPGKYRMTFFEDGEARERVEVRTASITAEDAPKTMTARLAQRGGFVLMIKAVD